jgi:hypothetical protein
MSEDLKQANLDYAKKAALRSSTAPHRRAGKLARHDDGDADADEPELPTQAISDATGGGGAFDRPRPADHEKHSAEVGLYRWRPGVFQVRQSLRVQAGNAGRLGRAEARQPAKFGQR